MQTPKESGASSLDDAKRITADLKYHTTSGEYQNFLFAVHGVEQYLYSKLRSPRSTNSTKNTPLHAKRGICNAWNCTNICCKKYCGLNRKYGVSLRLYGYSPFHRYLGNTTNQST